MDTRYMWMHTVSPSYIFLALSTSILLLYPYNSSGNILKQLDSPTSFFHISAAALISIPTSLQYLFVQPIHHYSTIISTKQPPTRPSHHQQPIANMSASTMTTPSTCCGRHGQGCVGRAEATCSCGKKSAGSCSCEKAGEENEAVKGATCSCGMFCLV
jgi:hypothetical protein